MGISYDDYIRTTEPRHHKAAQTLWQKLVESGDIFLGEYAGWYSLRDETFFTDEELVTRPDGTRVSPFGAPVEWVKEANYLFRLSDWQDRLLAFYEANPDFLAPSGTQRNPQLRARRAAGLCRSAVPRCAGASRCRTIRGRVIYVWLDALTNYLTATGWPDPSAPRAGFWPANLHMVGKDIARFHMVYWPAFLMAAGLEPPRRVFAGGWWTVEGEKMSKSVGNVIDPRSMVAEFGLDPGALLPAARDAVRQ